MNPPEAKLKKLEALLKLVDESITRDEFVQSFEIVVKLVRDLKGSNQEEFALMHKAFEVFSTRLEKASDATLANFKAQMQDVITAQIGRVTEKLKNVKDGKPGPKGDRGEPGKSVQGKPGKDGTLISGEEIIKKINRADAYISKDAIKGFAELEKAVREKTGNTTRIGWGAHPLVVSADGTVKDKNTRHISFKGTGVSSVTRRNDGVVEVDIAGSSSFADSEVPTGAVNGVNVTYTLSRTPSTGSLHLYLNGIRQVVVGDYSLSGGTITMVDAPSTGSSLLADFRY